MGDAVLGEFDEYVAASWPRLVRAAMLLGCTYDEAEDTVQSALTRCLVKWSKVRRADDRDAYVHRILINTYVTSKRRKWHGEQPTEHLPDAGSGDETDEVVQRDSAGCCPRHRRSGDGWSPVGARGPGDGAREDGRSDPTRHVFNDQDRQAWKARRSDPEADRSYDKVFAAAGFDVAHPELLGIDDQIRLVANAEVIAGLSGSALHWSGCAPRGAGVIEIGDARVPRAPSGMQRLVDAVSGHDQAFIPAGLPLRGLKAALRALDVSARPGGQ